MDSDDDPTSTFAIDVDTAAFAIVRTIVDDGYLPDPDAVRVEELVNALDYGYAEPSGETFAIYADGMPSVFGTERHRLLRIALKGREVDDADRRDANLVFAIDVSGSMARGNRLGLVKKSLFLLLDELRDTDSVGIVVYGDEGRVLLSPVSGAESDVARLAVERLSPSGSTYVEDGLRVAYELAVENYDAAKVNRVVVLSDGVGNVGRTGADDILAQVRKQVDLGITLMTVGFGMGNYNDVLMERLANDGNGTYHYIDSMTEARRVFVDGLTGSLETIAREAKIQVEFNPDVVRSWRLLGYENRDVADEDFRDDDVDGGEVGAGHEVTALYEMKPEGDAFAGHVATIRLRYADEALGEVVEQELVVSDDVFAGSVEDADVGLRMAALVAEYAELLRGSYWAREGDMEVVAAESLDLLRRLDSDPGFLEFVSLAVQTRDIMVYEERE